MSASKQAELYELCRKFVDGEQIRCAETIYQCDWVAEDVLPFLEKVCAIVGYFDEREEQRHG